MNTFLSVDPKKQGSPFESLFHLNTDAIFIIDSEGQITTANLTAIQLSLYTVVELNEMNYIELIEKKDRNRAKECFHLSLQGDYKEYRLNIINKNGEKIGCFVKFIPVQSDRKSQQMFLIMKSMKDIDSIAARYLESEMNFQIIAENVQDVIILMNSKKEYLYVSPSAKKVFAFDPVNALKKQAPFFNIHPDYVELLEEKFNNAIVNDEPFIIRLKALHEEKGYIWTELNGSPVFDKDNEFQHMVLVARDITLQKEQEEKLKQYAYHDPLTGLPNRRYFREYINKSIEQLNEMNKAFCVLMLDIDDFKLINDQFGHEVGDEVICQFAKRIERVVGTKGITARLGGDEFIVLLYEVTAEKKLVKFIDEIRKNIIKCILIDDLSIQITSSIGATICTTQKENEAYFLKRADIALYQVKEKGKNKYHINYA